MRKIKLGDQWPEVGAIGYGAMSFSDFYGPATDEGSFAVLDACMELGITHIDTANVYGMGRSETVLGQWLAKYPVRDQLHIATKASITRNAKGVRYFDNSLAHLEAELEGSLARMGIDYVDLFYVHRRDQSVEIEEVAGTLARIVESGKAKSFGFSEISPVSLRRAHAEAPVAAVQSEYSLSTRSPEMGLVQTCKELGVAMVAFSPVGRSLLTDHPLDPSVIPSLGFLKNNPRFTGRNYQDNLVKSKEFAALAADMGVPAAGLACAWCLAQGDHVIPIPGTRSVEHLREVAAGGDLLLSDDDLARIEEVLPIGWAAGERYNEAQWVGPEKYC